jgi:hypothetical protein
LEKMEMDRPLAITYHTYHQFGAHIIKESHWYLIKSIKQQVFTPQTEEDIEMCEWVPINALGTHLDNTHASIRDVIRDGVKLLNSPTIA